MFMICDRKGVLKARVETQVANEISTAVATEGKIVDEYADRFNMAPFMTGLPPDKWPSRGAPCMVGRIS